MSKISVITPSIRKDGLEIVRKALKRQTFKDFSWFIGSSFDPGIAEATWVKDDFQGGFWTLNRIYNALVNRTKDGLEKFYTCQKETGGLISGIGDQYEEIDDHGKPKIVCWNDPRRTSKFGSFYECNWNDCEFNWGCLPRKLFLAVGGMDEELDFLGYGGDQLQLCNRLNDYGAHFYLDQTNESFTLRHGREDFGGQSNWDSHHVLFNGEYQKRRQALDASGLWPVLQTNKKSVIEEGR